MTHRFLAAALLLAFSPALAQQDTTIRSITRYRIDGGSGGDFRAAVKEFNEVMKKGGSDRYYSMWQSATGPTEYIRVDYYKSYADLDRGRDPKMEKFSGELTAISARITRNFAVSERVIDEIIQAQSLPMAATPPKMAQVLRTVVKPDKVSEYMAIIDGELMPAIKKSGIKTYMRSRTRLGGPATEYRSVIGLENWAALDGTSPVVQALGGQAAYDRTVAKIRPLTVENEYNVYRFVPELSYLAPTASAPSGGNQ